MNWWQEFFSIFYWTDVFEICVLSAIIYSFSRWCARDRRTPLLLYFYACCAGGMFAHVLNLQTLVAFLQVSWPALVVIFLIVHQHTLQKNYIAGKTIIPAHADAASSWILLLLRAGIRAAAQRKSIVCIMQGNMILDEFLQDFLALNSPINKELLDVLVESTHIKNNSIMLVDQCGILRAFNGCWQAGASEQWIDHAIALTARTDALVWSVHSDTHLLTLVAQGVRVDELSSDKAEAIIAQYVRKHSLVNKSKTHEHINQKNVVV